jgi:hypothetical protein
MAEARGRFADRFGRRAEELFAGFDEYLVSNLSAGRRSENLGSSPQPLQPFNPPDRVRGPFKSLEKKTMLGSNVQPVQTCPVAKRKDGGIFLDR